MTNRLGFALLLKFFQIEGRFPNSKSEIPRKCAAFVAEQIDIPVSAFFKFFEYSTDNKTVKNQRAQIRTILALENVPLLIQESHQMVAQ